MVACKSLFLLSYQWLLQVLVRSGSKKLLNARWQCKTGSCFLGSACHQADATLGDRGHAMAILCVKLGGSLAVRSKSIRRAFPPASLSFTPWPLSQLKANSQSWKDPSATHCVLRYPWVTGHVSKAGRWSTAVGRFTNTWWILGDSYLSKYLKPDPLPKDCQITDGGMAIPGCPVPDPASTEGKAGHKGNKVSQSLDLVVIHLPLECRQGHWNRQKRVLPKTQFFTDSSDMESSPETWCHPFHHP